MDLRILPAHVHNCVRCFILGLPVLLLVYASSGAQAFPLSRFTEHLSGLGINVFGKDDNLPEHISVGIPVTSGRRRPAAIAVWCCRWAWVEPLRRL